jgi:pilus assembly protein CpaB
MRFKSIDFNWILLLIAIVLGGISAWATKNYFITKEQQIRDELSSDHIVMADVVVATQELRKGDIVSQDNMSVRRVRADILPLDAVHPSQFDMVIGQMILAPMSAGRPLISAYLPGMHAKQFSDLLKEGERAVTINIDEINSTAGMLVPADHIDLLLAFQDENDEQENEKLQLLIENVVVLAAGRRSLDINPELVDTIYDNPNAYNTVTLALSVEDAARVSLARNKGKFITLLRNQIEAIPMEFVSLKESQIFNLVDDGRAENNVEMIIGGSGIKTSTQSYPLPKEILEQLSQYKNKLSL